MVPMKLRTLNLLVLSSGARKMTKDLSVSKTLLIHRDFLPTLRVSVSVSIDKSVGH